MEVEVAFQMIVRRGGNPAATTERNSGREKGFAGAGR
ncbi:MAG: hypothetical protein OJF50_000766 [Nitrospira sp.]|jgi:hypothetical protein|nr:hypothetical protein [Nitrospira sp.]